MRAPLEIHSVSAGSQRAAPAGNILRRRVERGEKLFNQTAFDPVSFARCDEISDNSFQPCVLGPAWEIYLVMKLDVR